MSNNEEANLSTLGTNMAQVAIEDAKVSTEASKPELTKEQKEKLENQQRLYKILQQGGLFLKFIHNDLEKQRKDHLNRSQRRRTERSISKGQFTPEMIELYYERLQEIQDYIASQLSPKEPIDGAKFYQDLKDKQAIEDAKTSKSA